MHLHFLSGRFNHKPITINIMYLSKSIWTSNQKTSHLAPLFSIKNYQKSSSKPTQQQIVSPIVWVSTIIRSIVFVVLYVVSYMTSRRRPNHLAISFLITCCARRCQTSSVSSVYVVCQTTRRRIQARESLLKNTTTRARP